MNPTPDPPGRPRPPPANLLQQALVRLLRPLVRLSIQAGVTFPMLMDLLRGLYVEVASRDLLTDERSRTDSRISLLTGVHRKELRRQRLVDTAPEPPTLTVSSQVIARWLGSPALTGQDGLPLPLPRLGPEPSFEALVSTVTRDIRPRALLDTWLDQGVAVLDDEGRVRLQGTAFIPQADRETQVYYFARNLHDHAAAAAANVLATGTAPHLERAVHYDGLSAGAAVELIAVARAAATATLLDVNRQALAIADADDRAAAARGGGGTGETGSIETTPRTHRVNLGLYVYSEPESPDASS